MTWPTSAEYLDPSGARRLPFMVDFQYLDEGVRIRGEWFPVLKMHWVEGGIPLNTFVESHLHRPRLLHDLLGLWVKMARLLRQKQIAHADLQHDNVLLVPRSDGNLALKLIDYDGMHIPALEGAPREKSGWEPTNTRSASGRASTQRKSTGSRTWPFTARFTA